MKDTIVSYHFLDVNKGYKYYDERRSKYQDIYARFISAEPAVGGRVLDIGCGHSVHPLVDKFIQHVGQLDGVDPFPVVAPPRHIVNRWTCALEDIPVEPSTYDLAYSFNVVEHVDDVDAFLEKAMEIVKPGGVYWSLSPNARHPFTWVTRAAQMLRLKKLYQRRLNQAANDYPAYYRLSHDRNILRAIERMALPVRRIDFYYIPNVQWDTYFPSALRAIPRLLDKFFLLRMPKYSFIFMFRMERAEASSVG